MKLSQTQKRILAEEIHKRLLAENFENIKELVKGDITKQVLKIRKLNEKIEELRKELGKEENILHELTEKANLKTWYSYDLGHSSANKKIHECFKSKKVLSVDEIFKKVELILLFQEVNDLEAFIALVISKL